MCPEPWVPPRWLLRRRGTTEEGPTVDKVAKADPRLPSEPRTEQASLISQPVTGVVLSKPVGTRHVTHALLVPRHRSPHHHVTGHLCRLPTGHWIAPSSGPTTRSRSRRAVVRSPPTRFGMVSARGCSAHPKSLHHLLALVLTGAPAASVGVPQLHSVARPCQASHSVCRAQCTCCAQTTGCSVPSVQSTVCHAMFRTLSRLVLADAHGRLSPPARHAPESLPRPSQPTRC